MAFLKGRILAKTSFKICSSLFACREVPSSAGKNAFFCREVPSFCRALVCAYVMLQ